MIVIVQLNSCCVAVPKVVALMLPLMLHLWYMGMCCVRVGFGDAGQAMSWLGVCGSHVSMLFRK